MKNTEAVIQTKLGDIHLNFFPDVAPNHVNNFIELAGKGFYNSTTFQGSGQGQTRYRRSRLFPEGGIQQHTP